jgi:hypothetical protein
MMCVFEKGGIDGKGKAACIGGVVKGRCEESSSVCQGSTVGNRNGEKAQAHAGGCGAEGDDTWNQVSIDPAEGWVGFVGLAE